MPSDTPVSVSVSPPLPRDGSADAEVGHQRVASAEENVLRLHIAVNHAVAMGVLETVGHFARDPERIGQRELPFALETSPERLSLDVGHGEPEQAVGLTGVVDREDVRVLQPRRRSDLAQEPLAAKL